jgi:hypothetical protein
MRKETGMTTKEEAIIAKMKDAIKYARGVLANEIEKALACPPEAEDIKKFVLTDEYSFVHVMRLAKLISALEVERSALGIGIPFSIDRWVNLIQCMEYELKSFQIDTDITPKSPANAVPTGKTND